MARRTPAQAAQTRHRILDAAERLLVTAPERATLSAIASAASVTRGAIYGHFGSREGLLSEVRARASATINSMAHASTGGSSLESIRVKLCLLLSGIARNDCLGRTMAMATTPPGCDRSMNSTGPSLEQLVHAAALTSDLMAAVNAGDLPLELDVPFAVVLYEVIVGGVLLGARVLRRSDLAALEPALVADAYIELLQRLPQLKRSARQGSP